MNIDLLLSNLNVQLAYQDYLDKSTQYDEGYKAGINEAKRIILDHLVRLELNNDFKIDQNIRGK